MPFQLDPNILKGPESLSLMDRMQQVLTLSDLMDKRRMNQMALAQAQRQEQARIAGAKTAAEELSSFTAGPKYGYLREAIPEPQMPMEPQRVAPIPLTAPESQPITPEPQVIGRMKFGTEPAGYAEHMQQRQIAEAQAKSAPIQEQAADAGLAAEQAKYATDMDQYKADMEQYKAAQAADEEAKKEFFAAQAPEAAQKIPSAFKWMEPKEYKTYLERSSIDPDLGEDYIDKLVNRRKTLAESKKLGETGGYGNTDLGLNLKYAQDPDFVRSTQEGIQKLIEAGTLPEDVGNQFIALAAVKPLAARDKITEYLAAIRKPGQIEELTRPGKIKTATDVEKATAPVKIQTAAATEYAKTQAGVQAAIDNISKYGLKGIDPATGKAYTQNQSAAAGFALQMNQANDVIDNLAKKGFDEGSLDNAILNQIGQNTTVKDIGFNAFKDPAMKMYAQAKFNWCIAYLRKTSGAAINKDEYQSASKIFFGQYGDGPQELNQKRESRLNTTGAIIGEAGNAYNEFTNSINEYSKEKEKVNPYKREPAIKTKPGSRGNPMRPKSKAEYNKMPKGTFFIDDDNILKEKM